MRPLTLLILCFCLFSGRAAAQSPADSLRWRWVAVPRVAAYLGRAVPHGKLAIGRVDNGPTAAWVDSLVHDLRWVVGSIRPAGDSLPGFGVTVGLPAALPDSAVDWLAQGRGVIRSFLMISSCRAGQLEFTSAELQVAAIGDSLAATVIPRGMGSGVCGP